jgi:hypothetical protein
MAGYCELIWRNDDGEAVASMEFDDTQFWLAPHPLGPPFWQITLNPSGAQKDQLFSEKWQSLIGYRTAPNAPAPSLPEAP